MADKNKFKPEVTRIKLNPEQAVIVCSCYNVSRVVSFKSCTTKQTTSCDGENKVTKSNYNTSGAISS